MQRQAARKCSGRQRQEVVGSHTNGVAIRWGWRMARWTGREASSLDHPEMA
jgi:hypothetical protein